MDQHESYDTDKLEDAVSRLRDVADSTKSSAEQARNSAEHVQSLANLSFIPKNRIHSGIKS